MTWIAAIVLVWFGVSLGTVALMTWARGRMAASAAALNRQTALARWAGRR
jgi:hypothetical protein